MDYSFSTYAYKEFQELPKEIQVRIIKKLIFFLSQKDSLAYAKRMVGNNGTLYRFRIGQYRLIFECTDTEILVLKVAVRGSVYKR
jgi:mRNA interferase RelE/StbE